MRWGLDAPIASELPMSSATRLPSPICARRGAAVLLAALLGGCVADRPSTSDPVDRGPDGQPPPADAGPEAPDSPPLDGAPPDADLPDADLPDATLPDATLPDATLPDAGPCPRATPSTLVFDSLVRRPDDRLVGLVPCPGEWVELRDARLSVASDPAFSLSPPILTADQDEVAPVRFELFNPGRVTGRLEIDTDQGLIEVPLIGEARENACPDAAGRVPALVRVRELDVVPLDGAAAVDVDGRGLRPVAYQWVVTRRPEGSVSQPHEFFFDPAQPANGGLDDDPASPTAVFFADLPGVFTLELRVGDALGLDAVACGSAGRMTLVVGDAPPECDGARPCDRGVCREGFCAAAPCFEGARRRCHAPCGEGWQVCLDAAWGGCEAEPVAERCHDDLDDDCDGAVDEGCEPAACSDGEDDDVDGAVSFPADRGCASPGDVDESGEGVLLPGCGNGYDDDRDGRVDLADPGCVSPADPRELDPIEPAACSDGLDGDGDGLADFPDDPGCASAGDDDEGDRPAPPACDNGLDDDGDGRVDYPDDPGCAGRGVLDEGDPPGPPVCADGRDNDRDGLIDYPDDPGCASAAGASELG